MTEQAATTGVPGSLRDLAQRRSGLLTLGLLFLITIPLLTKIFTSDFGTHIAMGREIIRTMSVPDREYLNYPSLGATNPNGEWGFQAVLYLVYSVGGVYGVSLLCWAVVFGIFFFIHRSTVLRGADPYLAVVAIFAFSGFLRIRIQPRPEIFTYMFTALAIYLFSEYFFGKRKKLIYLFPPMILIWANTHPTYLMGFLLCGAFLADATARSLWKREFRWGLVKTWVFPPAIVGVLGMILCGLNPHGYDAILLPLHLISRGGGDGGGGSNVLLSISELTPVKGTGFFIYYKAALWFAAISLLLGVIGRRIYLLDIFLFAIAFKGAWDSARAVSMMGLFLSPGASLHLTGFLGRAAEWFGSRDAGKRKAEVAREKEKGKGKGKEKGKAEKGKPVFREASIPAPPAPSRFSPGRVAVTSVLVLALLVFGGTTLSFSFSQLEYGVGLTEHKFSLAAGEFMRKNPIPGNMFNFFDIGGFLDWQVYPQALTFLDGRTYNQTVFLEHQQVTGAMRGWEEILAKYNVNYIVLKAMDSSGMVLPLVPVLANDPKWSLVFADGLFLIFVRNTPENVGYLRKHEISKSILPQHIIWEAYHYMYLGVSPIVAYQTMSNMYEMLGNRQAAIGSLRKALEFANEPFLRGRLMQLEQGGGGSPHGGETR